jgi:hypothetical protein
VANIIWNSNKGGLVNNINHFTTPRYCNYSPIKFCQNLKKRRQNGFCSNWRNIFAKISHCTLHCRIDWQNIIFIKKLYSTWKCQLGPFYFSRRIVYKIVQPCEPVEAYLSHNIHLAVITCPSLKGLSHEIFKQVVCFKKMNEDSSSRC